jgi:hypothetical protein
MSFEELLQEHIKALRENTKALNAYTKALTAEHNSIEVEHTKESACKFCGITYKTLQNYIAEGLVVPSRRKNGGREYFKERDLVALCDAKKLYDGRFGSMRSDSKSAYYAG